MVFSFIKDKGGAATLPVVLLVLILMFLMIAGMLGYQYLSNYKSADIKKGGDVTMIDIRRLEEKCGGRGGEIDCYAQELTRILQEKNFEYSLQVLAVLQERDPMKRDCHATAHLMAASEVARDPGKWKELLSAIDPEYCGGGFLHGIIEGLARGDPSFDFDNPGLIQEICAQVRESRATSFGRRTCTHIMGHILLVEKVGNVPAAISVCSGLSQGTQYDCYFGVFMETYTKENLVAHGLAALPVVWDDAMVKNLETLCKTQSGLARKACWLNLPQITINVYGNNPADMYASCYSILPIEYREECYLKAVDTMASVANWPKVERKTDFCSFFKNNEEELLRCIDVVLSAIAETSPELVERAVVTCETLSLVLQDVCFSMFGRQLGYRISAQMQKELCLRVPARFRETCLKSRQAI